MAVRSVVVVEPSCVAYIEAAHECTQIGPWGLKDHVKMVMHQNIYVQCHFIRFQGFVQQREKPASIIVVYEDSRALIAPAHDMVEGAWILDS